MKTIIVDSSNNGILWTGIGLSLTNALRNGLLDCELSLIRDHNSQYKDLTQSLVIEKHLKWDNGKFSFTDLPENAVNPIFLEKKRLIHLRTPTMMRLLQWSYGAIRKTIVSSLPEVIQDISFSVLESNPENKYYHPSIVEYSNIMGIGIEEGYKELKLLVDNFRSQKIRIFSYTEYFANKINNSYSSDELKKIDEEIKRKFDLDLWI